MSYKYVIVGKYQDSPKEDVDSADTKREALYMLGEYRMAFGPGWDLKVVRRREKA